MDNSPDFDPAPTTEPPAPKRPRKKPQRTKKSKKPAATPPARKRRPRKRRVVTPIMKSNPARYYVSKEMLATVQKLLSMEPENRAMVLAIVEGLSK